MERVGGEDALVQEGDAEFSEANGWVPNHGDGVVGHREVGKPFSYYVEALLVEFCVATQVADPSVCVDLALGMS